MEVTNKKVSYFFIENISFSFKQGQNISIGIITKDMKSTIRPAMAAY